MTSIEESLFPSTKRPLGIKETKIMNRAIIALCASTST